MRPAYSAWFMVYFAVSYGASWLLSGPRYVTVFWPMAILTEEIRAPKAAKAAVLLAAAAVYTICFGMRWSVW